MDNSGKSLVDHWSWAANKGVMNGNTAAGLRGACTQVLSVLENWENVDVANINVEDLLVRFQNLKKKDFKPQVLEAYKRRFRKALESYLQYLQDPASWKPTTQERATPIDRGERAGKVRTTRTVAEDGDRALKPGEVEYPFPLRPGVMARLVLPSDLTAADVARLSSFMAMLVVRSETGGPEKEVQHAV